MMLDPVAIHIFCAGVYVGMLLLALGLWVADVLKPI